MRRVLAGLVGRLVLLAISCGFLIPSEAPTSVAAASGPLVTLTGHVLPNLSQMSRVGDVPATQSLTLTVALRPQAPDAIDTTVRALRMAKSPAYLSPDGVAGAIGQPRSSIGVLSLYFRGFGLTVGAPSRDHLSIKIAGTPAQLQQALGVQLSTYQDRLGQLYFATSVDPQLPSGLAPIVQAIFGLDNYRTLSRLNVQSAPSPGAYVPADLRTAYNVTPLLNAGFNGSGQTIGIIGCDTFNPSDIRNFQQAFGLPTTTATTVSVDLGPTGSNPETTLDLEWSQAIAPGAALRYYGSTGNTTGCFLQGVFDGITAATNENVASIISISLGLCESNYLQSGLLSAMENELGAAALQGQGVVVASGDQGAFPCLGGTGLGVSYPSSSAFVTAVGGTSLNLNQDSTYNNETPWGDFCSGQPCGGGGGVSGVIPEPSWQSGATVPLPSTGGRRGVPDISLDSDPATGYVIFYTNPVLGCFDGVPCSGNGGTSFASPEWAGIAAIANQYAGRRLGQLAPLLYSACMLSSRLPPRSIYHDVTAGNTGNPQFYSAGPNWDFATGWGSPNVASLVAILSRAGAQPAIAGPSPVGSAPLAGVSRVFLPMVANEASLC